MAAIKASIIEVVFYLASISVKDEDEEGAKGANVAGTTANIRVAIRT